ncbi:uncharacterized protein PV07_07548 [Cladophialophora immunda]|uniref:Zn(2)-C6 fungal-type domain-containing protein n=1 Tax=Cladophialophora immunda TaxID=569365 RepID=A0A0D2ARV8_9EURO|nr:uncharacterized protein PV07_07548 [Cladophialophora immunda]KIW27847.1 hypothetical protein PV07_07548 [Cladophialophora immunda]
MEWTTSPSFVSSANPRRIPPDLRKRAVISCDRCKKRRRKCVRLPSASTCELCRENAVPCVTTIPRKRPSAAQPFPVNEDRPSRQLLMEQLLDRLFPEVAVADANELANLADCLEKSHVQIHFARDKMSVTANGSTVQCGLASLTSAPVLQDQPSCVSQSDRRSFAATPLDLGPMPGTSPTSSRGGNCCERILQNSSGTLCYFGPSSSMAFVTQLREHLISTAIQNLEKLQPKQRRLRQKFVADNYCCTMEEPSTAKITQAPAAQRHGDSPQSSPEDVDDVSLDANAFRSPSSHGSQRLVDVLPARDEVEQLVELFFVHVHPNMTLFHRPLFQSALERLWTSDLDSQDVGWLTCCLLVLAFGCKYLASTPTGKTTPGPRDVRKLQQTLVEMALGHVARLIQCATLQSVQALALLALYLNTTHQRNASWIMMGCSIRMAVSLGMHRSDKILQQKSVLSTAVDRELRKRVWWSLYIYEQYNSALFGRPSAIDELETTSDLPTDSFLDEGYHRPPGLITHDTYLARIVDRIRKSQASQGRRVGCIGPDGGPGLSEHQTADRHLHDLDTWYEELPQFLRFDAANQRHIYPSHFRQLVTLQLRYQHARLLLTRPFYLRLVQTRSSTSEGGGLEADPGTRYGDVCVAAALDSWRLAQHLWERGQFNGDIGLDGVFLYQCGMVLALACLDTRQRWDVDVAAPGSRDRKVFYHAIEGVLAMLHDIPPDNPMSRMVQIADDFCSIVRSMKSEPAAASGSNDPIIQDPRGDRQASALLQCASGQSSNSAGMAQGHEDQTRSFQAAESPNRLDGSLAWAGPSPSLAAGLGEVNPVAREDELQASAWNMDGTQLIDSMLDWDLSQVFGFEGGGSMNNPFLV